MDAILFSANPRMVDVNDAINHLASHDEIYWEVLFQINSKQFIFPILGYIHISGDKVKYVATIQNIVPFSPEHYENEQLSKRIKPLFWIKEWKENKDGCRNRSWKNALVITHIRSFEYDTYKFKKVGNGPVIHPPQGYIRVISPAS